MAERALSPADYAMAVVKGDDKVEKILPFIPLAVGAGMGAYGAFRGAGGRFKDDEGNFNINFGGNARAQDPLTGGMLRDKDLGDSTGARLAGAGIGATQGLNPLTWLRPLAYGAKGMRAARAARASRLASGRAQAGAMHAGAAASAGADPNLAARLGSEAYRNPYMNRVIDYAPSIDGTRRLTPGGLTHSDMATPLRGAAHDAGAMAYRGVEAGASRLGSLGYADEASRLNQLARGGARVGQAGAVAGQALAGLGAAAAPPLLETDVNIPNQGMSGSALGQGGMGDMAGARHGVNPEQQIWSGQLEAQRNQQQPVATGENMRIGEQLLKEAKEDMDKDKSPKGKGKGMILIIGHGGKKSGKDDKKDSPC